MKRTLNFIKAVATIRDPYLLARHHSTGKFYFIRNFYDIKDHIKEGDEIQGELIYHSLRTNIFLDINKSIHVRWVNGKHVWGNIRDPKDVETPDVYTGYMNFFYGVNKRSDISSESTFDAIIAGERTATTRYDHIDYWQKPEVGDHIVFDGPNKRKLLVEITRPLHRLLGSGKTPSQWSKLEGWSTQYFHKVVKPKLVRAWQLEYKFLREL